VRSLGHDLSYAITDFTNYKNVKFTWQVSTWMNLSKLHLNNTCHKSTMEMNCWQQKQLSLWLTLCTWCIRMAVVISTWNIVDAYGFLGCKTVCCVMLVVILFIIREEHCSHSPSQLCSNLINEFEEAGFYSATLVPKVVLSCNDDWSLRHIVCR